MVIVLFSVSGLFVARWVLAHYFPTLEIREEIWKYWLPALVSVCSVAIWLRPRARILEFDKNTDDRRFFVLLLVTFSIITPSFVAQSYFIRTTNELHEVRSVAQIDPARASSYYRIAEFHVVENKGAAYADVRASGKYNEDLKVDLFFVFPIIEASTAPSQAYEYWYGIRHHKRINNRLAQAEKERRYENFYNESVEKIRAHDFFKQNYFEVVPPSRDRDNFRKAVTSEGGSPAGGDVVILIPGEGQFESGSGDEFGWIFLSAGFGLAAFLLALVWPSYSEAELLTQRSGVMPKDDALGEFKEILIPRDENFAAPLLLSAIVLVFLVTTVSGVHPLNPTGEELLDWGANRRFETLNGQWWRLVTSMFLHSGFMHLTLNAYGLILAAVFVEPIYGRFRFFAIYFIAGICGSLASIWWYDNTVSVGASGAIFGLFGAIGGSVIAGDTRLDDVSWILFFIGINLLIGLTGGIDNAAHIGGLLSGLIIGISFRR
jgi:rhomboid protease GluP